MARQFVDVTTRLRPASAPSGTGQHTHELKIRVAVDELRTFLSVLIRNEARNFDIRPVIDRPQTKPTTTTLPVEWKNVMRTGRRKRSLVRRILDRIPVA